MTAKKKNGRKWLEERPEVCLDIFESSRDALILADNEGQVLYWNKAAEKMFGYQRNQVMGKKFHDFIMPPHYKKAYFAGMKKFRETGRGKLIDETYEITALRKDKSEFPAELSLSSLLIEGKWYALGIIRDITGRRAEEAEKLSQKERYETVIRASADGFWLADPDGHLLDVNEAYSKMSGYSRQELLKMRISDLDANETPARVKKQIQKIEKKGHDRFERRHRRKDGSIFDVEVSATFLSKERGQFFTFIRDITELKKAREEINSIAKFPSENPSPVMRVAKDGTILYSNKAGARLLDSLEEKRWHKLMARTFNGKQAKLAEFGVKGRIFSFIIVPIAGANYANLYGRDITERRQAEDALRKNKEDLDRAQAVAHTGSWRLDINKNELLWSDETYRMFDIPKGTLMTYEIFLSKVHPDDRSYVDKEWQAALKGAKYDIEHRIIVNEGTKWVREKAELEFNEQGKLIGGFGTVQDITERKKLEEMKSEFVSIVSHQLRTPLTTIRWLVERLTGGKMGEFSQEQKDYLASIYNSNRRMIKLVDDLLSLSRLESGTIKVELEPVPLEEVIEETVKDCESLIAKCDCEVIFDRPEQKLPPILLDESLIRQVIYNLLTNAINYSMPHGRVLVKLEGGPADYLLTIADNGIGIPKDNQPRVFEKFFRAENAQKKQTEGTGLGLYISKMIVEILGGKIWFESEDNRGTTFYVSLPRKGVKAAPGHSHA